MSVEPAERTDTERLLVSLGLPSAEELEPALSEPLTEPCCRRSGRMTHASVINRVIIITRMRSSVISARPGASP